MVSIKHAQNTLQPVDYTQLLQWTVEEIEKGTPPFDFKNGRLSFESHAIARKISTKRATELPNPIIGNATLMRASTVNFTDQTRSTFETMIAKLYQTLHKQLTDTLAPHKLTPISCIAGIQTPLSTLQQKGQRDTLGFAYPFQATSFLQRKRLRVAPESPTTPSPALLRFSRASLGISGLSTFSIQVEQTLLEHCSPERCLKACGGNQEAAEEMHEDLVELLNSITKDPQSEFVVLQEILAHETVGQMKKAVLLQYLEFLESQFVRQHITLGRDHQLGRASLQTFIQRLHALDDFIWNRAPDDGFYEVSFGQFPINLRDLYARADALGKLPIIPLVEGSLGETTSKDLGTNTFLFGVKLKMDGNVSGRPQAPTGEDKERVQDVFNFYLNQLDPDNRAYQDGLTGENPQGYVDRLILVLLTYFFVFANVGNKQYDPGQEFETTILKPLKEGTQEEKIQLLQKFVASLRTSAPTQDVLKRLPALFRAILQKRERPLLPKAADYHLRVRRGLLEPKLATVLQERSFFRRGILSGNYKQALKYIRMEDATLTANAICKLDAKILLDDVLLYPSQEPAERFSLAYDIGNMVALPILLLPIDDQIRRVYENYFRDQHPIVIPYRIRKGATPQEQRKLDAEWAGNFGFIYRFVFSLVTFLSLQLLLELRSPLQAPKERVFLPLFRLHLNPKQESSLEETFIRDYSLVWAHLLSEDHLANHQGFYSVDLAKLIGQPQASPSRNSRPPAIPPSITSRVRNALSSLYSPDPRTCTFALGTNSPLGKFPLDRLAILTVSSRESDAAWNSGDEKQLILIGEVTGIDRLDGSRVRVASLKTFSYNTSAEQAYSAPTILADVVDDVYARGYHNILYIAHSPHTSTLRMGKQADMDEEHLYFMSKKVLTTMVGKKDDLVIYPVFFDKYYVVKLSEPDVNSLYIQDTEELTNFLQDPSQRIVPFFHLYNGLTVNDTAKEKYNGVIAYSTFWNIFEDIIANEDIHQGLLYDKGPHPSLKDAIMTYLTLFHFAHYERSVGPISLKLDPYENIIGDDSVGARALQPHLSKSGKFNLLAFLTEVRRVAKAVSLR